MTHLEKRVVALFTAFCFVIGCLCLRLYVLATPKKELVSSKSHYYSVNLASFRGEILYADGSKITETQYDNYVIAKPVFSSLYALKEILDKKAYDDARHKIENGTPFTANIGRSSLKSSKDYICVPIYKRYSSSFPAQHIIGYLDSDGHGAIGIEKEYDDFLYSDKKITARIPVDAYGRAIIGTNIELSEVAEQKSKIKLTIDKDIQAITEQALDNGNINEGCAVVIEINSGKIKAMASRPIYDPYRISDFLDSSASPFSNRCLQSFAVGSVFKVAVAAAAIEKGIDNFKCECKGRCDIGGVSFGCSGNTAHGDVDMQKALSVSCNTYFIQLGQKLGSETLQSVSQTLGFGQKIEIAKKICADSGAVPSSEDLGNPAGLANFSFGQGRFTASPLHLAQLFCAVGGGGKYYSPYLIESVTDAEGNVWEHSNAYPIYAISESGADRLLNLLTEVVNHGTASPAKPYRFSAAGKTATAQTGIFDSNGTELCNSWFAGCFPSDEPKYAVVIIKQNGSSGSEDCAPVFKEIADRIIFPNNTKN